MSLYRKLSSLITSLALVFSISATANADENAGSQDASPIKKVFLTQVNSYYSINGFYNFSANQGAQKDLLDINESISLMEELINSLKGDSDQENATEAYNEVAKTWKAYRKILNQNIKEVKKTGYPDLRLAGEMASANILLNSTLAELHTTLINSATNKPSKTTELSRSAATNLALMMTKYSARTTSTVSQVYAGGDGDLEITIDSLASEFSKQLQELMNLAKDSERAYKLLDSANTKWDFIKSSYINYNENRVNFIVNLYSKKIISDIDLALTAK